MLEIMDNGFTATRDTNTKLDGLKEVLGCLFSLFTFHFDAGTNIGQNFDRS